MIPKKIHYCWFGHGKLPMDVEACIKTWKKKCPDYEVMCWNEDNFDVDCHPFIRAAYDARKWAFVSDYARLKIIYDNGGIYLDTDVELVNNLDLLRTYDFYCGYQQLENLLNTGLGFGATEKNAIVKKMLDIYDEIDFDENNMSNIQCPIMNTKVLNEIGFDCADKVQIIDNAATFPACYFDPYASGKDVTNLFCDETISIHHYSASWTSGKQRRKRQIARIIGEDKILWIKEVLKK